MSAATLKHEFPAKQRLLISGATGFVGSELVKAALAANCELCVITRSQAKAQRRFGTAVRTISSADQLAVTECFDAIIHLAGANVFALPWFNARKQLLLRSRLEIADALMRFCERAQTRPKCWIQASAVGIYPTRSNQAIDETTPAGTGFAPELCLAIEARVAQAQQLGLRGVSMRLGLILGKNGGVFPTLRLATRLAGGVVVGDGTQRVAWVHLADVIGCIGAALAPASTLQEAINVVAPHAPTYREFIGAIASALHRPSVISAPKAIMRLALGERAPLLLEGAEILPKVLLANGFQFRHCTLESALKQLCP